MHDEGVHALVFALDYGLCKYDCVVGVTGAICDPILVRQSCRRVNHKLLSLLIVGGSSLHLDSVVSVAQLSEAEAAHVSEAVHLLIHEFLVSVGVQCNQSTSEQVELDSEFGS
jgi:hypothetical protein